jgi:peroxiredoxin
MPESPQSPQSLQSQEPETIEPEQASASLPLTQRQQGQQWLKTPRPRFSIGRIIIIVLVVATVAILLRALLTPSSPNSSNSKSDVPGAAAPLVDHYAPNVTLLDLHNNRVSLSSWRGKVVVLNFWYVACEPCRFEMPALQQTYDADTSKGLIVVGVNTSDDATSITQFVRGLGITYPILRDAGQRATIQYRVVDTPTSFIIDRHGVIRYKFVGPLDKATLVHDVTALLAQP